MGFASSNLSAIMTVEKFNFTHTQQGSIILRLCKCCCSKHAASERSLTLRARCCRTSWGSRRILTSLRRLSCSRLYLHRYHWLSAGAGPLPLVRTPDLVKLNYTPSIDEPPYSAPTPRLEQRTRRSLTSEHVLRRAWYGRCGVTSSRICIGARTSRKCGLLHEPSLSRFMATGTLYACCRTGSGLRSEMYCHNCFNKSSLHGTPAHPTWFCYSADQRPLEGGTCIGKYLCDNLNTGALYPNLIYLSLKIG
jgi:hypothetical protein